MPTTIATYRCLLISPSDVSTERDVVEDVIANWNAHIGGGLGARIEAVRWESHARPEMGAHPQAIINTQLVDGCDFGVAIFWSRLGSPTKEHESGSAEEVARLLAKGARVMVYFCTRPISQEAALSPQFSELQQLRKRYQEQGLLGSYADPNDLKIVVNLHITSLMSDLLLKDRAQGQPIPSAGTMTAPTPDIRVVTRIGFAVRGEFQKNLLSIGVENHSPVTFFAGNVTLESSSGTHLFVEKDAITGIYNGSRELEPGNSFDFNIDVDDDRVWKMIDTEKVVCAVVKDKIGRVFRGKPEDLQSAIESLRRDRRR